MSLGRDKDGIDIFSILSTTRIIKETRQEEPPRASSLPSTLTILDEYPDPKRSYSGPTPAEKKKMLENPSAGLPLKWRPSSIFELGKSAFKHSNNSCNDVKPVRKKGRDQIYFYKRRRARDTANYTDLPISPFELEAALFGYYQLLVPETVPSVHLHFDEKIAERDCVAISSKGIDKFKTVKDDPLTLTDLENPEIVKGLAYCLTASYIFEEDDFNRESLSKWGKRLDVAKSSWPIIYELVGANWFDAAVRAPAPGVFNFTPENIVGLPALTLTKNPYYWVTFPPRILPEVFFSLLPSSASKNPFRQEENEVYKQLAPNPVFQYYKYKVFLKFLLTDANMYRQITKLYISNHAKYYNCSNPDHPFNGKLIIDIMVDHQAKRLDECRTIICAIPEFRQFMQNEGIKAYREIKAEFEHRNILTRAKLAKDPRYVDLLIDMKSVLKRYSEIATLVLNNTPRPM